MPPWNVYRSDPSGCLLSFPLEMQAGMACAFEDAIGHHEFLCRCLPEIMSAGKMQKRERKQKWKYNLADIPEETSGTHTQLWLNTYHYIKIFLISVRQASSLSIRYTPNPCQLFETKPLFANHIFVLDIFFQP